MVVPFDFNQPEPDPGPVSTWRPLDQRRPLYPLNPNIGTTSGTNSIGVGAYDALQASVRQRPSDGLEFLASYTYGKALSDNVGYYGVGWGQTAGQGYYYLDTTDPLKDYGPSPYDMRHVFSLAGNYELPFGKDRKYGSDWGRAKNALLGGWNLNTIFQTHTGLPITVYDGGRTVAAGDALAGAAQPDLRRQDLGRRRGRRLDRHQLLPARPRGTVRRFRRRHPLRSGILERGLRPGQELLLRRPALS